jgi:hypothetical protein
MLLQDHIGRVAILEIRSNPESAGSVRSRGNALRPADSRNVKGAEHDGIVAVRQGDNDLVTDNRGVLRMLDAKYFAAAAMNLERREWSAFQKKANLLEHGPILALSFRRRNSQRAGLGLPEPFTNGPLT